MPKQQEKTKKQEESEQAVEELEEKIEKSQEKDFEIDDSKFAEFLTSQKEQSSQPAQASRELSSSPQDEISIPSTLDSTNPTLREVEGVGPRGSGLEQGIATIPQSISTEQENQKNKNDDPFKYIPGGGDDQTPKYINEENFNAMETARQTNRVDMAKLGRDPIIETQMKKTSPASWSEANVASAESMEKYQSPQKFDQEKERKRDITGKKDVQYKKMEY